MNQATNPIRMGMLLTVQAGAERLGGFPVRRNGAHAYGQGDGDPALRVWDVDSPPRARRVAPNDIQSVVPTDHSLPATRAHRPPYVVR